MMTRIIFAVTCLLVPLTAQACDTAGLATAVGAGEPAQEGGPGCWVPHEDRDVCVEWFGPWGQASVDACEDDEEASLIEGGCPLDDLAAVCDHPSGSRWYLYNSAEAANPSESEMCTLLGMVPHG